MLRMLKGVVNLVLAEKSSKKLLQKLVEIDIEGKDLQLK